MISEASDAARADMFLVSKFCRVRLCDELALCRVSRRLEADSAVFSGDDKIDEVPCGVPSFWQEFVIEKRL